VLDAETGHFIFEVRGEPHKIDQFIQVMAPLGLVEVCRTGVAAMNRGAAGMKSLLSSSPIWRFPS
jgi:acetolactate synthase I/III small subunit